MELELLVIEYDNSGHRAGLQSQLDFFEQAKSWPEALEYAANAHDNSAQKMNPHQRRVGYKHLRNAVNNVFPKERPHHEYPTFEAFFHDWDSKLTAMPQIGPLASYDTLLRLGAFLGLLPNNVFLQTGSRDGAENLFKAIGNSSYKLNRYLPVDAFPRELRSLKPWEIEAFLCIYKKRLSKVTQP